MSEDHHYRTVVTRLDISDDAQRALDATIDAYREACQIATDMAWNECYQPGDVQALAYDPIREQTALKSQHTILATRQASEAIAGCVSRFSEGEPASKPEFTAPCIRYDSRTMTLFDDWTVSLATLGDRVRANLALPADSEGYQFQYLDSDSWTLTESTLSVREGDYLLNIGVRKPMSEAVSGIDGRVLGVDFGIEHIAVTSTAEFFSGGELSHQRRAFARRRDALRTTGTESAMETLESIEGREKRYVRDVLHTVSKAIVDEATAYECSLIALEDLENIQSVLPDVDWMHYWTFGKLARFLEYKAEESGIEVVTVDPEYTSKRCPECGCIDSANRPTQAEFACIECGRQQHADYNAAVNIGLKHVRRGPQSSRRTGARRCALKSGTVTPSGEFIAYPDGSEAESADKS